MSQQQALPPKTNSHSFNLRRCYRIFLISLPVVILLILGLDILVGPGGALAGNSGGFDLGYPLVLAKDKGALLIALCAAFYAFEQPPSPGPVGEPVTREEFNASIQQLEQQNQRVVQEIGLVRQEADSLQLKLELARAKRDLSLQNPIIKGDDVERLQKALSALGYAELLGPSGADGIFGASTDAAVKQFQADKGLPINGFVADAERDLLEL